jgi:quinoprotein glucose dehydrogenase
MPNPAIRIVSAALLLAPSSAAAQHGTEWPAYGADVLGTRWSSLTQVTRENVARLSGAWRVSTGEADSAHATSEKTSFEATPIVLDGAMYLSTPTGRVLSLEPESGRVRWTFDPRIDRSVEYGDFTSRGVSAWTDRRAPPGAGCARRIIIATIDGRLIALDAARGTPCRGFGKRGSVVTGSGTRRSSRRSTR